MSLTQNRSKAIVTAIHEAKQASGLNGQVGSHEGSSLSTMEILTL